MTQPHPAQLDFEGILRRSLALMADNLLPLAILAGLLVGVPSMVFGQGVIDPQIMRSGIWEGLSLSGLVLMLGQAMLQAAVTLGLLRQIEGAAVQSLPDLLAQAWGSIVAVIGVSLVKGIVIGFCYGVFALSWWLIFPVVFLAAGAWISAAWLVAIPAAVAEKPGIGAALQRSQQLTRAHRWTLIGYFIALWLLGAVLAKLVWFVFGIFSLGSLAQTVVLIALAALDATVAVVVYHQLRGTAEPL